MALIAEFSLPIEAFALRETLPAFPEVTVEADRIAAHSPGSTLPCLWAYDDEFDGFDDALDEDPSVEEIHASSAFDDARLYYIEWANEIDRLVEEMIDNEGVILEATGHDDTWRLRIRFLTRDQLAGFQSYFDEHGPRFRLKQLFDVRGPEHSRGSVTPEQHRALTFAAQAGYFEIPREISLQEVADEFGVSHQAMSERLRRGMENVVFDLLDVEPVAGNE